MTSRCNTGGVAAVNVAPAVQHFCVPRTNVLSFTTVVVVLISVVAPETTRFPVTTKSPAIVASPACVTLKISAVEFATWKILVPAAVASLLK